MTWTIEQKLAYLYRLPWTVSTEPGDDPGETLIRVVELPAVVGCGSTEEEVATDFWGAMRAVLESYLHHGDPIPLPEGLGPLPWEPGAAGPMKVQLLFGELVESPSTEAQSEVVHRDYCAA